ncbi:hypothetical protein GY14_04550 [Delftia tsuruhatensis]|nr:hypothetical protein GY14_04550 [Delftia tsuruhatensis]
MGAVAVACHHRAVAALQDFFAYGGAEAVERVLVLPFHARLAWGQRRIAGVLQGLGGTLLGVGLGSLLAGVGPSPALDGDAVGGAAFMPQARCAQ